VRSSRVRLVRAGVSQARGTIGFLPNCAVTVRIACSGDEIVDYLTYVSDADGFLSAPLPETAVTATGHIAVTDNRPDPAGGGGLLWSNTVIVTP
jgi:hypothetical protein